MRMGNRVQARGMTSRTWLQRAAGRALRGTRPLFRTVSHEWQAGVYCAWVVTPAEFRRAVRDPELLCMLLLMVEQFVEGRGR